METLWSTKKLDLDYIIKELKYVTDLVSYADFLEELKEEYTYVNYDDWVVFHLLDNKNMIKEDSLFVLDKSDFSLTKYYGKSKVKLFKKYKNSDYTTFNMNGNIFYYIYVDSMVFYNLDGEDNYDYGWEEN